MCALFRSECLSHDHTKKAVLFTCTILILLVFLFVTIGEGFSATTKYDLHYYDGAKLIKKVSKSSGASLTDAVTYANAPVKPGKTFIGWYSSATGGAHMTTMPAKNIKVYARYQDIKYRVKYYDHNNVLYKQTSTALYDSKVISGPVRAGYTFTGWYMSNGTKITKIRADRELYARYTLTKYDLHYYDGSKLIKITSKTSGASLTDAVTYANAPKKDGYIFIGWYSSAIGGAQVTKMPAKNIKVYARYKADPNWVKPLPDNAIVYLTTTTAYRNGIAYQQYSYFHRANCPYLYSSGGGSVPALYYRITVLSFTLTRAAANASPLYLRCPDCKP